LVTFYSEISISKWTLRRMMANTQQGNPANEGAREKAILVLSFHSQPGKVTPPGPLLSATPPLSIRNTGDGIGTWGEGLFFWGDEKMGGTWQSWWGGHSG
jgi:hypothetical protein